MRYLKMETKSLTIPTLLLVLWLAMSAGTLADDSESWTGWLSKSLGFKQDNEDQENVGAGSIQKPSEEQMMAEWLQVLRGAEAALEADNKLQASAMIAGVIAKFGSEDRNASDKDKLARFKASVKAIQQAVDKDQKAKATSLIKGLSANFNKQYGGEHGVKYLENEEMEKKKQMIENYLQQAFQAIKEEKKATAEEMVVAALRIIENNKGLSKEEKVVTFVQFLHEAEKFIKEDSKQKAEEALQGAAMAIGIHQLREQQIAHTKRTAGLNILLAVEQKLQAAFQALHQEQQPKAQEMLKTAVITLNQDASLTDEEKSVKLTEIAMKAEKSLNKDQQVKAEQLLKGATMGFRINFLSNQEMKKQVKPPSSITPPSNPSSQGNSQNSQVLIDVELKLRTAFDTIQKGGTAQGHEILKTAIIPLIQDRSFNLEQKSGKLVELVKKCEPSLGKEAQMVAERFLQGAVMGLKIQQLHQATLEKSKAAGSTAASGQKTNWIEFEQKLKTAFQAIQNGQTAQGNELVITAIFPIIKDKSTPIEEKSSKFIEIFKRCEKSLNKETQIFTEQFLERAKIVLGFQIQGQVDTKNIKAPGTSTQENVPSAKILIEVEQKLQAAFQVIQKGQVAQGNEMLNTAVMTLVQEKSFTLEEKSSKLVELVKKCEPSLSKENQVIAKQFLQGATMGLKIQQLRQSSLEKSKASGSTSNSGKKINWVEFEKKLKTGFQAIQNGQTAQGNEFVITAIFPIVEDKSTPVEEKSTKFIEIFKRCEQSLNKETQVFAEQFLERAKPALGFQIQGQVDTQNVNAHGPSAQGNAPSANILIEVEQKLQAAFQVIQKGQVVQGNEMLKSAAIPLMQEKSLTLEEKLAKLVELVKKCEPSLNKENQVLAEQFLQGATAGLKINKAYQASAGKEKTSSSVASGPSSQGSFLNVNVLVEVEQKLQVAFQVIQKGEVVQGNEMLKTAIIPLMQEKSLTIEEKLAKLVELVKRCEPSLNKETQMLAEQFLQGATAGLKINKAYQAGAGKAETSSSVASSSSAQGSFLNVNVLVEVEQKLQAAFQVIQKGQVVQGNEMLKTATIPLMQEKLLTIEEKVAKLVELVKRCEPSLNKETQLIAEQFLQGETAGFKVFKAYQAGAGKEETSSSVASGTSAQGRAINMNVLVEVEQKLQVAFQVIQKGQVVQGNEMLKTAAIPLMQEKSLTLEEKLAKLVELVKKYEPSLNKKTQMLAEKFLQGATASLKINKTYQAGMEKTKTSSAAAATSGSTSQGSSQDVKVLKTVESNLLGAFEALHQQRQDKAQEMLKFAVNTLNHDKALTNEEKSEKLTEFVHKGAKILNKEQQEKAKELVKGATVGFSIHFQAGAEL